MNRVVLALTFLVISIGRGVAQDTDSTNILSRRLLESESSLVVFTPEMENSDGYFEQFSTFSLSFLRYRPRNYDARYTQHRYFGLKFDDFWLDRPRWAALSGLSYNLGEQIRTNGLGFDTQGTGIGSVGGSSAYYLSSRPYRRLRGSYSLSNRTYTHKGALSYQNSELNNEWSVNGELSFRGGESLTTEGVFALGAAGTLNVQKQLNSKQNLALTLLYSPIQRANASPTTQESYSLTGTNQYNPNWGWQQDQRRSVRVSNTSQPIVIVSNNYAISPSMHLFTSAFASYGTNSYSTFNWRSAPNPNPNYYRYLPSYQSSANAKEQLEVLWSNDQSVSQVNFDALANYNQLSPSAHYIIEERVNDILQMGAQSTLQGVSLDQRLHYGAGVEFYHTSQKSYKRIKDLLGADHWIDIDYFTESDDDYAQMTQNNMAEPNRVVREGDIFGYNYLLDQFEASIWAWSRYRLGENIYFTFALSGANSNVRRTGLWEKQMFTQGQSLGKSPTAISWEATSKIGVEYRLGARLSVGLAAMLASSAPSPDNLFLDVSYRNAFIENPTNEIINSFELNFNYNQNNLRVNSSLYYTSMRDAVDVTHFYSDFYSRYSNMVITDIDRRYMGFELGAQVRLYDELWLKGALAISDNRYTNNPSATLYYNTDGSLLANTTLEYRDLHCSPLPSSVGSLSLAYQPYGWNVSLSINGYYGAHEVLSPARYMSETILEAYDPIEFTHQAKLPSGMTLDIFGGRTFILDNGSRLNLYAGINNLTNSRNIQTISYQSSRLTKQDWRYIPRANNLYYALGINGFVSISYIF